MPRKEFEADQRYVLVGRFSELTGYTARAIYRKIEKGTWIDGIHYRRAPDGHILMDLDQFNRWVEGS